MHYKQRACLRVLFLGCGLLLGMPGWSVESGRDSNAPTDIFVERIRGEVGVTMEGVECDVALGTGIELPSHIRTAGDGSIDIRQGGTGVAIAPNSHIEIPEAARGGQLIARMVQHSGNAFYDVETRPVEKLRVETPYLVAVVKGTQFNVSVANGATTISLFEGLLEIRSPDDSQVIELDAGEIAIRSAADTLIRVLPMDADLLDETANLDARPLDDSARGTTVAANLAGAAAIRDAGESSDVPLVDRAIADGVSGAGDTLGGQLNASLSPASSLAPEIGAGVDIDAGAAVGESIDVGLDADLGVDIGGAGAGLAVETGLDAGVDLGGGAVDVGLDAGLDAGVDLGGAGVDLGADAGVDAGVDLGSGSIDLGADADLDAGADLGGGGVDLGAEAGLDTGLDLGSGGLDAEIDAGLDAGLDTDPGADTGLDVGLDADVGVDAGTDGGLDAEVGVELGAGDAGVGAGIDLDTGLDVDIDIDIDLGGGDEGSGGGLLGPLL